MLTKLVKKLYSRQSLHKNNSSLRICFVIPASPTEAFYSQVAMLRLALDSFGGIYRHAHIVFSLGNETIQPIPERWLFHLGVHTIQHWVDPQVFHEVGQRAQGDHRWEYDYTDYDLVIFCDADIILLKPIDDLLIRVKKKGSISGVIAHYPFPHEEDEDPAELWRYFSQKFTGKDISLNFKYTLSAATHQTEGADCPFYVNFGFVVMTPQVLMQIRDAYLNIRSGLVPLLKDPRFSGQIALALAVHKYEIPAMNVSMEYNFPNDPVADQLFSSQVKSISVLHYLRTNLFDRQKIFTSEENFKEFLSLRLEGSNKVFQEFIRKLTGEQFPFN